ncbi:hypothetical protein Pcaca05_02350 [Pectobacterium carotovorum subsp. carotovorum]|nr:hypothetical protein Pcaca05_02350 [Pectobacterium carotovorum subsp. carotovorum]
MTNHVIQPLETVTVWQEDNPIIPAVASNVVVTNNGNTKLEIVSYWAPPSQDYYPDTTYWAEPNETVLVKAPPNSLYYYRINVTNSSDSDVGAAVANNSD